MGDGFPEKKNLKVVQGHRGVMFRFFRSSYENVEFEDFWQSVLQFGWELTQQLRQKVFIKTFSGSEKMREDSLHRSVVHLNHILKLNGTWLDFFSFLSFFFNWHCSKCAQLINLVSKGHTGQLPLFGHDPTSRMHAVVI